MSWLLVGKDALVDGPGGPHDGYREDVADNEQPQEDENRIAQGVNLGTEQIEGQPGVYHPHRHGFVTQLKQDSLEPSGKTQMAEQDDHQRRAEHVAQVDIRYAQDEHKHGKSGNNRPLGHAPCQVDACAPQGHTHGERIQELDEYQQLEERQVGVEGLTVMVDVQLCGNV